MIRLVVVRLGLTLPILLGVSVVAFALMRALPGDFAQASAGTRDFPVQVHNGQLGRAKLEGTAES